MISSLNLSVTHGGVSARILFVHAGTCLSAMLIIVSLNDAHASSTAREVSTVLQGSGMHPRQSFRLSEC